MLELREVFAANGPQYVMLGGLIIGFVFGYIVFRTNFCTMGAISDFMSFGDFRRFRAWILAGATAIVGTQLLVYTGVLPISETMYIVPVIKARATITAKTVTAVISFFISSLLFVYQGLIAVIPRFALNL